MDVATHTLVAITAGAAGYRRWGAPGLLTLAVAANLPELERLAALAGPVARIHASYAAAHSLLTAPLLGVLAAVVSRRWLGNLRLAAECAGVALASHLALDLASGPGVRLLWPLSTPLFGRTLLAHYDLLTLAALLLALVAPQLLNLVNRDIGASTYNPQPAARLGLAVVALLVLARGLVMLHIAEGLSQEASSDWGLAPSAIHPLSWYAVRDTGPAYTVEEVTLASAGPALRFRKLEPNRALETAADTPLGRAFLAMARFPQFSLESGRQGMLVRIRDLRFFTPAAQGKDYSVEIEVTSALEVVAQRARL